MKVYAIDEKVETLKDRLVEAYNAYTNDGELTNLIGELSYVASRASEIQGVAAEVENALANL